MSIFLIPILVGAFGWLLVWGIVKIIFYPIHALKIGPFKWTSMASQWVGQIDLTILLPQMTKKDSFETLKPLINEKLDVFFKEKLSTKLPMISMFIGDKTIEELKVVFMEELAILFPVLTTQLSFNLNQDLHQQWQAKFNNIIAQKITKASLPLRWVAFALGAIWGCLMASILPLI